MTTEVTSEARVFMRHIRAAGYRGICGAGTRDFFKRNPQLSVFDLNERRGKGIPVSQVIATGEAFALRVAAQAEKEARNG